MRCGTGKSDISCVALRMIAVGKTGATVVSSKGKGDAHECFTKLNARREVRYKVAGCEVITRTPLRMPACIHATE